MSEQMSRTEVDKTFFQMMGRTIESSSSVCYSDTLHPMIAILQGNGFSPEEIGYVLEDMGFEGVSVDDEANHKELNDEV